MIGSRVAIRASQLSKAFGGRTVLDAVDMEIAPGESVALTGANGSGKTTLLGCLASMLRPDGGEVYWFGRRAGRDVAMHRWIGSVAHESGLYSHLTLRENLIFAARMCGMSGSRDRADQWLDTAGLAPHADVLPTQVSRGMRQRLAVVRALIHDPALLLLDEPFTCLDAAGAEWLLALLTGLHDEGRTICFVSHEQERIGRLAQRILQLRDGKVHDVPMVKHESRLAARAA